MSNQPARTDPRADVSERAARTTMSHVAAPVFTCVTPDVPLARLRELFITTSQRAVAVVDADDKLEGLVATSDLVGASPDATVTDVMAKCVHALPEDAPLSYAISLMAQEDISEVPVVTGDGTVVGIAHALDVLRWLASSLGYQPVKT